MSVSAFDQLCQHVRETALLSSIESLLGWDERTKMPPAAAEYRAEQVQYLAGWIHRRQTDPQLGEWLAELSEQIKTEDPHGERATIVRQLKRQYDKRVKLPQSLVEQLARLSVLGQQCWQEARRNDDYASFRPLLDQIIQLKRQQAECIGYERSLYDPLLDDFEPHAKTDEVAGVLAGLRDQLVPLVAEITDSGLAPRRELLRRRYPVAAQETFAVAAAKAIGYDFARGRLDVTAHPFCTSLGPHDHRITTRYDEHWFPAAFFGVLHEAGHALYEQGLPPDQFGLPTGEAVSMGIHESQSRMWENLVGRSRAFWQHFFPAAKRTFAEALSDVGLDDFYFAVNDVQPSLIRVEADEVTYNLHIVVRFELEQALLSGDLTTADLPAAWNEKYEQYLGIQPPNDADGVLQDVHWSAGLFGYFPTYALGNLYAAQFFARASDELGDLDAQFARGDFRPLLEWLRSNIHRQGQRYTASELVQQVTGQPLSHQPLIRSLRAKFAPLYRLRSE